MNEWDDLQAQMDELQAEVRELRRELKAMESTLVELSEGYERLISIFGDPESPATDCGEVTH